METLSQCMMTFPLFKRDETLRERRLHWCRRA